MAMQDGARQCHAVDGLWNLWMTDTVSQNVNAAMHSVSSVGRSHTALVRVPCGGRGKRN